MSVPARALVEGVEFSDMPDDDELLRRALDRTDRELLGELRRVIWDMRRRLREGGTPEQVDARRRQLGAALRAYERLRARLGGGTR